MGCWENMYYIVFLIDLLSEILEQYVEENERLRAILGEWSTRAAKVQSFFVLFTICGWNNPSLLRFTFSIIDSSFMKLIADMKLIIDWLKLERALEAERMSNLELQKKLSTSRNQSNVSTEPSQQRVT